MRGGRAESRADIDGVMLLRRSFVWTWRSLRVRFNAVLIYFAFSCMWYERSPSGIYRVLPIRFIASLFEMDTGLSRWIRLAWRRPQSFQSRNGPTKTCWTSANQPSGADLAKLSNSWAHQIYPEHDLAPDELTTPNRPIWFVHEKIDQSSRGISGWHVHQHKGKF